VRTGLSGADPIPWRALERLERLGLAREGNHVVAVGHIDADIAEVEAATAESNIAGQILPLVADLRRPADCGRVVAMAVSRFGGVYILVNSAGLTFTTIDPARFRRAELQKFWRCRTISSARSSRPITSPPIRWPAGWRR
jgi:NAD(P)-dependent dehydrogenase (short-subunit alcohol dehydrogenase family)